MTSAFTWAFGFLIGATVGWICRARQLPMGPPKGSYGPRQPASGMRRIYYDMPSTIAECGGPCAAGPRHCDCGALWRDEPVRLDPGPLQPPHL